MSDLDVLDPILAEDEEQETEFMPGKEIEIPEEEDDVLGDDDDESEDDDEVAVEDAY